MLDRRFCQGSSVCRRGTDVGIVEVVAVIVGVASLMYLAYAMIRPDRI